MPNQVPHNIIPNNDLTVATLGPQARVGASPQAPSSAQANQRHFSPASRAAGAGHRWPAARRMWGASVGRWSGCPCAGDRFVDRPTGLEFVQDPDDLAGGESALPCGDLRGQPDHNIWISIMVSRQDNSWVTRHHTREATLVVACRRFRGPHHTLG